MKKNLFIISIGFCTLAFAQYPPDVESKIFLVKQNVEKEIELANYKNEDLKNNRASSLEAMQMMDTITPSLFILEESGEEFFHYNFYVPNTEYAVKMLSELNNLMTTDSKFWKRKYVLSRKSEIELTENEKKILGRASFPRVSMNQIDLSKYSKLSNQLSIYYETLLKIEKEEVSKMSRSDRKAEETRIGIIEKIWNKQLQDNQDIQINWSKSN